MTAMTAAVAAPERRPARHPGGARARHLVAVPTGQGLGQAQVGLQVTRRGRLALLGLVLGTAAGAAAALGLPGAAAPVQESVTVQPGQTLSSIAAAELPGLPVREAATQIQLANDLSTPHVHAGQTLSIPTP